MSVLRESYPLSSLLGATVVYPHQVNEVEAASWFEQQLGHCHPSESKRYVATNLVWRASSLLVKWLARQTSHKPTCSFEFLFVTFAVTLQSF